MTKIVIDIDDDLYNVIQSYDQAGIIACAYQLSQIIKSGTSLDDIKEQQYNKGFYDGYKKATTQANAVIDDIKAEIEQLNPVDYGSMFSYESHNGAKDMKMDVLEIIDRHIGKRSEDERMVES